MLKNRCVWKTCVPACWGAKILSNTYMMDYSLENTVIKVTCAFCYLAIAFRSYLIWGDSRKGMFPWAVIWWTYRAKKCISIRWKTLILFLYVLYLNICKCVCAGLLSVPSSEMNDLEGDFVIVFNTMWNSFPRWICSL